MNFEIKSKEQFQKKIFSILKEQFSWSDAAMGYAEFKLINFLNDLQDDIYIGIDYPYVDKMYRDSYYHYYSSKLYDHSRNCIRLSFFDIKLQPDDFFNLSKHDFIRKHFLGFLVLRPISKRPIGRNILRPNIIKKQKNYYLISTKVDVSINGLKLSAEGFPHSSQDSEMMVCAETTIWSVMEYFSHRYPEYHQILPTDINKILHSISPQRQTPSNGLNMFQISYVLKKLGLGVKVYVNYIEDEGKEKTDEGKKETDEKKRVYPMLRIIKETIIPIYVESGIPILTIVVAKNEDSHVFNIIGRIDFELTNIFKKDVKTLKNGAILYDYYELSSKYIIIDDNSTPYDEITLDKPTEKHKDYNASIDTVIVPLHKHIYLEADDVQALAFDWVVELSEMFPDLNLPPLVLKTFLSSSRNYKNYILCHPTIDKAVKKIIISLDAPKFLWIIELSTTEEVIKGEASGIILIDATEPYDFNILGTLINGSFIEELNNGEIKEYSIPLPSFKIFNNLTTF